MAFPSIVAALATSFTSASTTQIINLPSNFHTGTPKVADDLLVVLFRVAVAGAMGFPDFAFSELFDASADGADDQMALAWYRWTAADVSSGDSITMSATCGSGKGAAIVWLIRDAADPSVSPPQLSTVATGVSPNQPNATTCTPTGGAKDYLWITFYGMEGEQTGVTTYPSGYTLNQTFTNSGTGGATTSNVTLGGAGRTNNAASEDAGAWVVAGTLDDWTAYTMAIHPVTAVDPTLLGYRPMLPAFALNGQQNPVEPGGMTPACYQVPDVLTG